VKGEASKVIPEIAAARHVDLILVGTMNRTGLARWFLGNMTEHMLRRVNCDVLVIKPDRVIKRALKIAVH
jgi:universal stress protein E